MEAFMVEFYAHSAIKINDHVNDSVASGTQNVIAVSCLINTGDDIIDGSLAVVMNANCDGYTVRVDDSHSGVPIGQVRSDQWLSALDNCVTRVNNGQSYCPVYVPYDAL